MRERLTVAVLALSLVLMAVVGAVRGYTLRSEIEQQAVLGLAGDAEIIATVVDGRHEDELEVTAAYVDSLLPQRSAAVVQIGSDDPLRADSAGYEADPDSDFVATEAVGDTEVTLTQSRAVIEEPLIRAWGSLTALLLVLVVLAAFLALLVATWMSRPVQRLSRSAAALARGRTDLDLPTSKIPEVVSISESLRIAARQLEESIARDRDFFQHASHVLRTPLTGLRLELEDLTMRDEVDADVRRAAAHCVEEVTRLDAVIGELLSYSRAKTLVAGAEVSLLDLGSRAAQTWRDAIPEERELKTFVDGDPDVRLTPGPVEQLLDLVLADVVASTSGVVTLRFKGETEHVRISVTCGAADPASSWPAESAGSSGPGGLAGRSLAEVLGGRYDGEPAGERGLAILLPRR